MCAYNHDDPCHTPYAGSCVADECVCEKQPDDCEDPDVPSIECDMVTCIEGQFCLHPGLRCDKDADPPELYSPTPECTDIPPECDGTVGDERRDCLGEAFCPTHDPVLTGFQQWQLECPPEALACSRGGFSAGAKRARRFVRALDRSVASPRHYVKD